MASRPQEQQRTWTDEQVLELVREHERLVCSYLRSLGCPPDRVDDLAQETFLRLFSRPPGKREPAHLRGTLFVVARNLHFNSLRDEAARPRLEEVERAWNEFERGDGGSAYLDALRACLEQLPLRTREALELRFGSGAARSAIAARLQLSLGGVKSLLSRATEDLRACVRRRRGANSVDSLGAAQ